VILSGIAIPMVENPEDQDVTHEVIVTTQYTQVSPRSPPSTGTPR
jgi:hypothetical protein